ncbi:MAG: hypothetical protein MRY64_11205 [Hyphomonadaceae bacterium]|nr:hypothetical protein [Hyphomonadaceae bacterium]
MRSLARLLLFLAIAAYAANGAQTHLRFSAGEAVEIPMCGLGGDRTISLHLGDGDGPEKTSETCCGACMVPGALPADSPQLITGPLQHAALPDTAYVPAIHPRSTLWPGAPPQGPPLARKA